MSKPKKELEALIPIQAPISRRVIYNANHERLIANQFPEVLPPLPAFIDDEDFDTVAKELWLHGYWIDKKHPGYCIVAIEMQDYAAKIVAAYTKLWSETRWTLKTPEDP